MDRAQRFAKLANQPFVSIGGRHGSGAKSFVSSVRAILADRSMLALLVRRDIKSRYKDSALGLVWTLIRPLTQLAIFFIVVGKFLGAERGIPEFAVYIFTGLTAFGLFQEIVSTGTASILGNAGLVKKVAVSRELFPLAATGTALFNFLIQFAILLVVAVLSGTIRFDWTILYLPLALVVLISFGIALALLLSALFVYLRDVGYLVEVALMVMLWASPILYSWEMVRDVLTGAGLPWLLELYSANPITLAVLGFQEAIWGVSAHGLPLPDDFTLRLLLAAAVGIICIFLAQRVFGRLQGNFAQEL